MRFTADMARQLDDILLDERIEHAIKHRKAGTNGAYIRIYIEDSFRYSIQSDLEERGFKNVDVPDICLCGDVYFEWD